MYQEAFEAIQGLFKTGVIDWIRFTPNGDIEIKISTELMTKIFKKDASAVEILEYIEKYES